MRAVHSVHCCAQALLDDPPPDPADGNRLDLSHMHVYTIDDEVRACACLWKQIHYARTVTQRVRLLSLMLGLLPAHCFTTWPTTIS